MELCYLYSFDFFPTTLSLMFLRFIHIVGGINSSALLLTSIPLHWFAITCLSIFLLLNIWVASRFWLSWSSSVQSLSCVRLFVIPWTIARQASLSVTNSPRLLKLMSIESVMES